MRADALGIFWRDEPPPPKQKKVVEKKTPPEPTWLADDYIPEIELKNDYLLLTDSELGERVNVPVAFDSECYTNYFSVAFLTDDDKYSYFELSERSKLDIPKLRWVLENLNVIGFNSLIYDIPMLNLALAGLDTATLKEASDSIIKFNTRPAELYKAYKTTPVKNINHIDLINVAPLESSLKIYSGRVHCKRMQDLPFHPDKILNPLQMDFVKSYLINDLSNTRLLFKELKSDIDLRIAMSDEYGIDLRSKSDARIAEAVIGSSLRKINNVNKISRPIISPGTTYKYNVPRYMQYKSDLMRWVLNKVAESDFIVSEFGNIGLPSELSDLSLPIGNCVYRMGIGGLHSTEKSVNHISDADYILKDVDVVSYYPKIILNQGLYPEHLGPSFLRVYDDIVSRRIQAKRDGNKSVADTLKIVINGSFGKLGSMYSILYAPDLLIQVTLTGQLSLLMLIETLELEGFEVVSANTDGVVTKVKRSREKEFDEIVKTWERITNFETEETQYKALYSRDVNNYIAVKTDGKVKLKGAYAESGLRKNPANEISVQAVIKHLSEGIPLEDTITSSGDINQFVTVRNVRGGAVKVWEDRSEYLGKAIRWYYAKDVQGDIVYAKNGNKVPRSEGARPLMDLPDTFPNDIDYDWYINESREILEGFGL